MVRKGRPRYQVCSVSVRHKEQKYSHLNVEINEDGTINPISTHIIQDPTVEKCMKLYGTISIDDGAGFIFLYNQPREMPKSINTNDTIPLSMPRRCLPTLYGLDVRVDLKDADGDLEISRGWLVYDRDEPICIYPRRSCVIPGTHGSTIVYYMRFLNAILAYVKVQLFIDGGYDSGGSSYVLSGSILARYSGQEYDTEYERKHYQIELFSRNPENDSETVLSVEVDENSKSIVLPLSCRLLAVQVDTSLIIETDLVVESGKTEIATMRETAEFHIPEEIGDGVLIHKMIAGNNAQLSDMDQEIYDFGYPGVPGTSMLEVFSVSFTKTANDDRRSELYSTIHVAQGQGDHFVIYDREPEISESKKSNETITLTGPPRVIPAVKDFSISLYLKDRYRRDLNNSSGKDEGEDEDLEISNGKIYWNWNNSKMDYYCDKLLSINVPGRDGFATVHFAVFNVAIEAEVQVLLEGNNEQDNINSELYGTIFAYYGRSVDYSSSDQKEYFRTTFLNRSAGNCAMVKLPKKRPGNPIPLLRSKLAVPAYASLVIEVVLFSGDSNVEILREETAEILAGTRYGEYAEGKGLRAEVKVCWKPPYAKEYFKYA